MLSKFKKSYNKGVFAEYYAAAYLTLKGYRILKMRYKTKVGEVDIIAKRGGTLCFAEVKYRATLTQAVESVRPYNQSRIRRTAEHFLLGCGSESNSMRFDVIAITPNFLVRHIHDAF